MDWAPNAYDLRADGSRKGTGFLGVLQRPDGGVSSEISIGVPINGQETDIPTLVPTLDRDQINYLLNTPADQIMQADPGRFEGILQKAVAHAQSRIARGQSVFSGGTSPDAGGINMGMGGYSLGGMDPDLVRQVLQYTEPSPFTQAMQRDPSILDATSSMIQRQINPTDSMTSSSQLQAYHDANGDGGLMNGLRVAGGVLSAPIRLLGGAVHGLQDILGAPAAQKRQAQDAAQQMLGSQMLLDPTLSDAQKIAYGMDPQRVAAVNKILGLMKGDPNGAATYGAQLSGALAEPAQSSSFMDLLTGAADRHQAEQQARVLAYKADLGNALERAKIGHEQADTYAGYGTGTNQYSQAGYHQAMTREVAPNALATRTAEYARAGAEGARAGQEGAQARLYGAQAAEVAPNAAAERLLKTAQMIDATNQGATRIPLANSEIVTRGTTSDVNEANVARIQQAQRDAVVKLAMAAKDTGTRNALLQAAGITLTPEERGGLAAVGDAVGLTTPPLNPAASSLAPVSAAPATKVPLIGATTDTPPQGPPVTAPAPEREGAILQALIRKAGGVQGPSLKQTAQQLAQLTDVNEFAQAARGAGFTIDEARALWGAR